jgi:hypothetical protein
MGRPLQRREQTADLHRRFRLGHRIIPLKERNRVFAHSFKQVDLRHVPDLPGRVAWLHFDGISATIEDVEMHIADPQPMRWILPPVIAVTRVKTNKGTGDRVACVLAAGHPPPAAPYIP